MCKICNKRTNYMYKINDGLYCENHWQVYKVEQDTKFLLEGLKERIRVGEEVWNNRIFL